MTTGIRPGEYLGLRWWNVDLDKGNMTVRRAASFSPDGWREFTEPKTAESVYRIPLSPPAAAMLIELETNQTEKRTQARARSERRRKPLEHVHP